MDKLREGVLIDTFTQFANNQLSKEQSFIKILGFLGAVVFGYAYIFKEYYEGAFQFIYLCIATISSSFLLTGGAWLVVAIGYTFRRDQHVNARIKMHAGLIGGNNFFSLNYNPLSIYLLKKPRRFFTNLMMPKKIRDELNNTKYGNVFNMIHYRWLPDIFLIYYVAFPVFISIVNVMYVYVYFDTGNGNPALFIPTVLSCLSLTLYSYYLPIKYSRKLLRRLLVWSGIIKFGVLTELEKNDIGKVEDVLRKLDVDSLDMADKSNNNLLESESN